LNLVSPVATRFLREHKRLRRSLVFQVNQNMTQIPRGSLRFTCLAMCSR
jgi:hypothetical protein